MSNHNSILSPEAAQMTAGELVRAGFWFGLGFTIIRSIIVLALLVPMLYLWGSMFQAMMQHAAH
jgi:hypothetical protein